MNNAAIADAYQELNQQFIMLVNDISALSGLSRLNLRHAQQEDLLRDAMRALLENSEFERCSVFLLEDDILQCAGGLDWSDLHDQVEPSARTSASFHIGEGIIGMAAETGHLQHCHDCSREPRFVQIDGSSRSGSPHH